MWKTKKLFNTESEKTLALIVDELHKFLGNIIAKSKEIFVAGEDLEDKDVSARIVRRAQGEQLDETFLVNTTVSFVMAGQDTICSALTWFFWRLFPPIPLYSKEAVEDDIWPDGKKVKKGTSIIYHIFAMGTSQELWSSDWADFHLERWLERRKSGTSYNDDRNFIARDPFTYPVFQAAPRTCLGKEIAVVLMKMVVATILKRFLLFYSVFLGTRFCI
ncbi:hypothetical protein CQW23_15522 [Capsicum baccatum]|uniref:Uncharacterized protein n=1 Tax=Capsicum baccatum TaxID=33114 RepID=A0A2G2WM94_CAPBA|nr:hypothetical protein CQW23_15522 [Capsicum baccatum]